ncbi:MAG: hypothetical protein GY732_12965 [Gammaproteobacteria bacterium]|nr:hypothetical protein [Gammaproteobacteria bacterium]
MPGIISLSLMAMYFSGNAYLQNIVAPTMDTMPLFSAREFGALEMLQNLFLLFVIAYSVRCLLAAHKRWVKLVAFVLVLISVFTLLEEIDYGIHFVEYFTGQHGSLAQETWNRNWHNKTNADGTQYVSYIKLAASIALLFGFVLAPFVLSRTGNSVIQLLLPSKWMASTVILLVSLSFLAHWLDDAGYAIIGEAPGNLYKNVSEFRELNMYYILLLYTATLFERINTRQN